ncbi:hypothetical protein MIMGU_mgv1a017727mg [Erythranthe guttata]|uniref:Uncharacterized protein n=1 Tax=Erythranthe guttata TaxID=4155 RepID=A0A022RRE5_ERYGU|nr:hypothetical protein MIMGU_mgv1a017727mg [Erythranthe guttata]
MAVANKTRDLKRKLELSKALTATCDMDDDPIVHSMPQTLGPVKEKRGRGLTRGLNTQKYIRKCGEKPKIVIPRGINKPVGEHSSKHATQIGVLIRLEAPMKVEGWAKIPNEKKEDLFRRLVNKLSYDVEEPHVVSCIWKSFAKQYSTFRSNAHMYYKKMRKQGGVALARETIYEKLANRQDDWLWLCDFWETPKFKKISETQSNNRSNLEYTHKLGTKSRAAHQHENKLDDVDMYTAEFYNTKNGWADEEAEANSAKMKVLKEQQQALPEDERMSVEQICITVLGENSSYAKAKGLNKKSSAKNISSTSEVSTNGARLEEDLASTQAELANAKADLAIQKSKVDALVKFVENMSGTSFSEIIDFPNW